MLSSETKLAQQIYTQLHTKLDKCIELFVNTEETTNETFIHVHAKRFVRGKGRLVFCKIYTKEQLLNDLQLRDNSASMCDMILTDITTHLCK